MSDHLINGDNKKRRVECNADGKARLPTTWLSTMATPAPLAFAVEKRCIEKMLRLTRAYADFASGRPLILSVSSLSLETIAPNLTAKTPTNHGFYVLDKTDLEGGDG